MTKEQFLAAPRARLAAKEGHGEDDALGDSLASSMEPSQGTKRRKISGDEDATGVQVGSYSHVQVITIV